MGAWLEKNLASIVVALILLLLVLFVIIKLIRDRKNGKCSCSFGCEHCAMKNTCHDQKKENLGGNIHGYSNR